MKLLELAEDLSSEETLGLEVGVAVTEILVLLKRLLFILATLPLLLILLLVLSKIFEC